MARKAFAVSDEVRERVRYLSGVGVRQDDIARIVGCAPKTLRKRLRDELDCGIAEANATVAGYLFNQVKAGNITAIIFWLKTRAGWREREGVEEQTSAAGTQSEILVLPDNARDQELTEALREAQEKFFAVKQRRQRG
jgi:hypothetical protein